jgi:glyoxylase-like metal-dependent hydrolase (beta-lactamase superfamily II)
MDDREVRTTGAAPQQVAPGVHWVAVGRGLLRANVYFMESGGGWVLIDAGAAGSGPTIREAAAALFGPGVAPAAILLTHDHTDHAGAVRDLAETWDVAVWIHPDELPLAVGAMAAFHDYANPLDRWVILPFMRLLGSERADAVIARGSLKGVVLPLNLGAGLPGLPDWDLIPTPGHTPGHIALFRRSDRVLITGDALLTMNVNSPLGFVARQPRLCPPPRFTSWDWPLATRSMRRLAELRPAVIASGHGVPMAGAGIAEGLARYATPPREDRDNKPHDGPIQT